MHWLDTTLLVLLAVGAALGFYSGLLWQVVRLASFGLALYGSVFFHAPAVELLRERVLRDGDPRLIDTSAYVVVFLTIYGVLLLAGRAVKNLVTAAGLGWIDRGLGGCLGLAKAATLLGVLCFLGSRGTSTTHDWIGQSTVACELCRGTESALEMIPDEYKRNLADSLTQLKINPPQRVD
jgi:membrane protein required for colicin V production